MTPAARVQAAIEVLDRVLAGAAAEQALTGWARGARYAGSGDRAAVRDLVFDALRRLRSYTAMAGAATPSGRALMIGAARAAGTDPAMLFTGGLHAPARLSAAEAAALAAAPDYADLPDLIRADCPDWLAGLLADSLGPAFLSVMAAQRDRAPVFLRVNLRRSTRDEAVRQLAAEGIRAAPHPLAASALEILENSSKIRVSHSYLEGMVELQDASSQAAVELLPLADGAEVLDYCAGGGGKTLAMAARAAARFTVHDAAPARMRDLAPRAARAGVRVRSADQSALKGRVFDLVLIDAPCSGSGTWRRTPDAKWRLTPARLAELTALQDRILDEAAAHVRPGGTLAYMTCSLIAAENGARVDAFLARRTGFSLGLVRRFSPLQGGDGFFAALLTRA
jgi:16S rRNA (cytosine967-C5)-methyltransferase